MGQTSEKSTFSWNLKSLVKCAKVFLRILSLWKGLLILTLSSSSRLRSDSLRCSVNLSNYVLGKLTQPNESKKAFDFIFIKTSQRELKVWQRVEINLHVFQCKVKLAFGAFWIFGHWALFTFRSVWASGMGILTWVGKNDIRIFATQIRLRKVSLNFRVFCFIT